MNIRDKMIEREKEGENEMKIEVLFPEFCNLFGERVQHGSTLKKTLPEAEFIRTKFSDDVRFTEEKMNLVYMGPMTERMQEQVIRKLMPLKEKIQKAIDDGTVFLFHGQCARNLRRLH